MEVDNPSALTGSTPYTINPEGTITLALNPTSGLIEHTDYYAGNGSAGAVDGYVEDHWVEQGSDGRYDSGGTPTGNWTYTDYTTYDNVTAEFSAENFGVDFALTMHPVASTTLFSQPLTQSLSTSAASAETTTYGYTFYPNTAWVQQETDFLPSVSDEGTGVGGTDTIKTFFDIHGRPEWTKEASGTINFTSYDPATGALLAEVDDVSSSSGLPAGWSLAPGSHLNLTTVNIIDRLGRTVIHVDPYNNATFTLYGDSDHEVRVYQGWKYSGTGSYTDPANFSQDSSSTLPPVEVEIDQLAVGTDDSANGLAGTYGQVLTMAQPTRSSSTVITENGVTLPIGGQPGTSVDAGTQVLADFANVRSLSVAIQNQAGQTIETDDYYDLTTNHTGSGSTWAYSAGFDPHDGTAWDPASPTTPANYYRTTLAYGDTGGLERVVNPDGVIRRTVYDSLGRVTSTWIGTGTDDGGPTNDNWSPDSPGSMIELTANVYDPNKSDGTASGGALTTYTYATDGHVEVKDPNNHTTKYLYDAAARLVEIDQPPTDVLQSGTTDASAAPTTTNITPKITYGYGDDGLVSTITDQNGNRAGTPYFTTYYHDALGRTTSVVSPQVNVLSAGSTNGSSTTSAPTTYLSYDGDSNVVSSTDANSGVTSFAFDMFDNVVKVAPPGDSLASSGPGKGAIYAFDNLGDLLSAQTADGTTTFDYNSLGQKYRTTQPAIDALQSDGTSHLGVNPVTTMTFDALGNLATSIDANANIPGGTPYSTAYYHDSLSRLTSVVLPNPTGGSGAGPTTTYAYDLNNELISVTNPLNNVTSIDYFRNGLQKKVTLPNPSTGSGTGGPAYQYDYTAGGQIYTVKDPFNNTTTYSYTTRDQLASVQLPNLTTGGSGGPVISFYHDANGNQTAEKDPDGNTTYYNFDPLNRLSDKREYVALNLDPTTSYTTQVDANVATGYLYDAVGNLTRVTDGDGHVIGYDYSGLNQRTAENWFANASSSSSTNTISNTYLDGGELHTASSAAGTGGDSSHNSSYTFAYNQLGWVTSVDNNGGSTSGTAGVPDVVLNAQYDLNGNRTKLAAQVGSGLVDDFQNSYAVDRLNRETSVVQQAATSTGHYAVGYKKSTFGYDNGNRLTSLTDYKDSTNQAATGGFSYDHDSRITALNWQGPGGGYGGSYGYFEEMSWTYDSDSRVGSFSNAVYSSENLTYTYDHDSQLTSAAAPYGGYGGGVGGGTYGWDGNGDSTLSGHVTGKGNRLLSDGTYRYWYDKSGHMIERLAISTSTAPYETDYAYNNRGQLISVTDRTPAARRCKRSPCGTTPSTT